MQNPQSLRVYCSNIECGLERLSSAGSVPIRSRRHRRMIYVGKRRIGLAYMAFVSLIAPQRSIEMGTYYLYACPVCGQEAVYLEKWGILRRVE